MTSIAEMIDAARASRQATENAQLQKNEQASLQNYQAARVNLVRGMKNVLGVDVDESVIERAENGSTAKVTIDGLTFVESAGSLHLDERVYVQIRCPFGHYPPADLCTERKSIMEPGQLLDAFELLARVAERCRECVREGKRKTAFQILIDEIQVAPRVDLIAAMCTLAHKANEADLREAIQVLRL